MNNIYETDMAKAFSIENYHGTKEEKIALRDLAAEMSLVTEISFGEPGESKSNFARIFNSLLNLDVEDLEKGGYLLVEKLFKIKPEAYMDYGSASLWYQSNKAQFDVAYEAILQYMRDNYPELLPQTR